MTGRLRTSRDWEHSLPTVKKSSRHTPAKRRERRLGTWGQQRSEGRLGASARRGRRRRNDRVHDGSGLGASRRHHRRRGVRRLRCSRHPVHIDGVGGLGIRPDQYPTRENRRSTSRSTASSSPVAHMWRPTSRSPAPHRRQRERSQATSSSSPQRPSARGEGTVRPRSSPSWSRHRSRLHRRGRWPLHRRRFADPGGDGSACDTWTHDPLRPTSVEQPRAELPGGNNFHMTEHVTTVACTDDPAIIQAPPPAPLDTLIGVGDVQQRGRQLHGRVHVGRLRRAGKERPDVVPDLPDEQPCQRRVGRAVAGAGRWQLASALRPAAQVINGPSPT